jgi:hypothetical protein
MDPRRQVVAIADRLEAGRPRPRAAARQAGDDSICRRIEEIGHRVAVAARAVDHPVRRRGPQPVAPARPHVADIDQEGAGQRRGIYPDLVGPPDLQAALPVLGQDRDETVVGMRGRAILPVIGIGWAGRVVQQPEEGGRALEMAVVPVRLEAAGDRDHARHLPGEALQAAS